MEFRDRLSEAPSPSMTTLPDGSVDRRLGVLGRRDVPETRESFAERVAAGDRSFVTTRRGVEPGGQCVNAATQARALGADVSLYGHLGHEVFELLDVECHSMGAPADVNVYEFHDGAVMMTSESTDIRTWEYDDLAAAGGEAALDADAVVWGNWASLPNATDAFHRVADRPGEGGVFVLDPGDVTIRSERERRALLDALAALESRYDVVVSANDHELGGLCEAISDAESAWPGGDPLATLRAVRERAGVAGVVMHGVERAAAATRGGDVSVENFETADQARFTGGGDRFSSALAFALACGWPWADALRLGNAAASYYVSTGSTGGREELATFVTEASAERA